MTNPKIRKCNKNAKVAANVQHQQNDEGTGLLNMLHDSGDGVELNVNDYPLEAMSDTEDLEEECDEAISCSSFSLQECINEFRARRIRRLSTQSREVAQIEEMAVFTTDKCEKKLLPQPVDADLINQNRSNKEQERKCKPCRDGFCYCFTSDSGEGGGVCAAAVAAGTRVGHVRQTRRHRRSESNEPDTRLTQLHDNIANDKNERRDSVPVNFKTTAEQEHQALPQTQENLKLNSTAEAASNSNELTAISRLETSSSDAPLIHIIQELHNNCVISEVRVNKDKIQSSRQKTIQTTKLSPNKLPQTLTTRNMRAPSAPPLETGGVLVQKHGANKKQIFTGTVLDKISELDSLSDAFAYSTPLTSSSSKHTESGRRRHKAGGRLLQKRLSLSSVHSKPRRSLQPAPPKPPRSYICLEDNSLTSTSTISTSTSLREAERILDDFLSRKGAVVRERNEMKAITRAKIVDKASQADMEKMTIYAIERKREQRKSCPTSLNDVKQRRQSQLPSCPSLSDLQRSALDSNKKYTNYEKNIRRIAEKPIKELSFGWKETKISDMLNCDTTTKRPQFKSQAVQAEPQQAIGWQVPPKIDLDTVDGVCSNLAANIANKNTPVKTPPLSTPKKSYDSQKFIWKEQLRNLSPWCNKKSKGCESRGGDRTVKSNLKSSSRSLFRNSKKKILRLVTPKRDNLECRRNYSSHSIGIQTCQNEFPHHQQRHPSYEPSGTPQSPPGSYHSAVPMSTTATTTPSCSQNTNDTEVQNFDFSRTVNPPPKKAASRSISQRKLNFPLSGCAQGSCISCEHGGLNSSMKTKTYRSYHGDLDQDVTLSKLGYILGNIRAKLEASDDHAVRTFQEIEQRERLAAGFDCTDGVPNISRRIKKHIDITPAQQHYVQQQHFYQHEPIYSEIEEDSIHIMGTPQYDNNTTSARAIPESKTDLEVLYARVNKANKKSKPQLQLTPPTPTTNPIALGKVLHDSLRNLNQTPYPLQLPTLPELSDSDTSYMSPPQPNANITDTSITLSHCQSLNNVRMQEQHSSPKRDKNLNKSDLSLHRSEIFLDNLCRSELIAETGELELGEKINNNDLNKSYSSLRSDTVGQEINTYRHFSTSTPTPEDSISYDTPNDDDEADDLHNISQAAISQLGLSLASNESITSGIQNALQKRKAPKFTTKSSLRARRSTNPNISGGDILTSPSVARGQEPSTSSCPATPQKTQTKYEMQSQRTSSLKEVHKITNAPHQHTCTHPQQQNSMSDTSMCENKQMPASVGRCCIEPSTNNNNFARYQRLKNVLRKSFKCSKNFVRNETKRLSSSFSLPSSSHIGLFKGKNNNAHNHTDPQLLSTTSTYDLDALFALDEQAPVVEQLAQAVTICRQLPEVEISPEMVEAERLLLFSRLRRDAWPVRLTNLPTAVGRHITGAEHTQRFYVDSMRLPIKMDVNQDFFFNYFYIVTFECGGVIKSTQSAECHNGWAIFDDCGIEFVGGLTHDNAKIRCNIFMLRLRKVSTLSLEPRRPITKLPSIRTPGTASSSSSSGDEIVSRFRLHANFTLTALNFVPYEYVESESQNSEKICLRGSCKNCVLPLTHLIKSSNLTTEIQLCGRAGLNFAKQKYSGFLNVQDPHTQHNWNRRWCSLNGIHLDVWPDENQMDGKLLLTLDMRTNLQCLPLQMAPRELCARARSFCLQCSLQKGGEEVDTATVFFATDTQEELDVWLDHLNTVLKFVNKWLRGVVEHIDIASP